MYVGPWTTKRELLIGCKGMGEGVSREDRLN